MKDVALAFLHYQQNAECASLRVYTERQSAMWERLNRQTRKHTILRLTWLSIKKAKHERLLPLSRGFSVGYDSRAW